MEATTNSTGNLTAAAGAPLPFDAGSILVLAVTLIVFCGPLFMLFPPFPPRKSDALQETHNKLGAPAAPDPSARLTGEKSSSQSTAAGTIRSLVVYPVRSCRGVELDRAKVEPAGLEFDRLFAFAQLRSPFPVDVEEPITAAAATTTTTSSSSSNNNNNDNNKAITAPGDHRWECITQRQFPRLAELDVEVWRPDLAKIKGFRDPAAGSSDEAFLVLRFPWSAAHHHHGVGLVAAVVAAWDLFAAKCAHGWRARPHLEVLLPLGRPAPAEASRAGYVREPVRVGSGGGEPKGDREDVMALHLRGELPEELRLFLGVSNRLGLFRFDRDGEEAAAAAAVASRHPSPVHFLNLASVRDLQSKAAKIAELKEFSARHLRANIFVSGLSAHDEVDWNKIKFKPEGSQQVEEAAFNVSCQTVREPRVFDEDAPKKGCLGVQVTPLFKDTACPETFLEVGMSVEVLARSEPMYEK